MTVRGYQVAFDWSRHGVWTNTFEDCSSRVTKAKHITAAWGRTDAQSSTTDSEAGKLEVDLNNQDRRFSPENTSSAIAAKVLPGTPGRLQVTHPVTGAITTLFQGPLDAFTIDTTGPAKTFSATCLDGWGTPGAEALSTPVYTGQRTGFLISVILDAIGWTGGRDIDAGATVVPYWWEEGTDANSAVSKLVASEGPPAIAYVKGGTFVFRDRHHRITRATSLTSQGTFTHVKPAGTGPAGDFKMLKGSFTYDHGLTNIANSVTFQVDQRVPTDTAEVWNTDTPFSLGASEVRTIIAQSDSDPFMSAVAPVAGVDYQLTSGTATVTINRTSGQTVFITVTAGGSGAYFSTGLSLRATPIPVATTVQVQVEDASSVGTFGRKKWGEDVPWAAPGDAFAIAQRIVAVYSRARPTVIFRFAASPAAGTNTYSRYLAMVLGIDISQRVTVREDDMGLNADFIVEHISHEIQQLGNIHFVELSCQITEPVQPSNIFQFGLAGHGFNDGFFAVDGIDSPVNIFRFDTAGVGFDQGVLAT